MAHSDSEVHGSFTLNWNVKDYDSDVDEDSYRTGETLRTIVRKNYLHHLKRTLKRNVETITSSKSLFCMEVTDTILEKCTAFLEERAVRKSLFTQIYQRTMSEMISEIKNNTQKSELFPALQEFLENEKLRCASICDKDTQTENSPSTSTAVPLNSSQILDPSQACSFLQQIVLAAASTLTTSATSGAPQTSQTAATATSLAHDSTSPMQGSLGLKTLEATPHSTSPPCIDKRPCLAAVSVKPLDQLMPPPLAPTFSTLVDFSVPPPPLPLENIAPVSGDSGIEKQNALPQSIHRHVEMNGRTIPESCKELNKGHACIDENYSKHDNNFLKNDISLHDDASSFHTVDKAKGMPSTLEKKTFAVNVNGHVKEFSLKRKNIPDDKLRDVAEWVVESSVVKSSSDRCSKLSDSIFVENRDLEQPVIKRRRENSLESRLRDLGLSTDNHNSVHALKPPSLREITERSIKIGHKYPSRRTSSKPAVRKTHSTHSNEFIADKDEFEIKLKNPDFVQIVSTLYGVEESINRLPVDKREYVNNKFVELFGKERYPDYVDLSTSQKQLVCRKRIASFVVPELTVFYTQNRFASKVLFKSMAKYITNSILRKNVFPAERGVRDKVRSYFSDGTIIREEDDYII